MKAYVLIKIRSGEIPAAIRDMRKLKSVLEANMVLGPYDAVSVVQAEDLTGLGKIIASEIQPIPGVDQTFTCLAVDG